MKPTRVLIWSFLAILFGVPLWQVATELQRGLKPQALEVFKRKPSSKNLRAYEHDLEDASEARKRTRSWAQYAQFAWFRDGGEQAIIGRDGWLFYGPSVRYLTERPGARKQTSTADQAFGAITAFRDDLAARGIKLLVLPVPNKESIYPERLTRRVNRLQPIISEETRELLRRLRAADVEVLDLWARFGRAKLEAAQNGPLYLAQDTHWSPAGAELAAREVTSRLLDLHWLEKGSVRFDAQPVVEFRTGDVLRMLQVPAIEKRFAPERVQCDQVIEYEHREPYRDGASDILVLGDSFLRIYETDGTQSSGFVAHLAKELKQPITSLVNDGGGSTLVRQELSRRPTLLANKKVVVWEFAERDIRLGIEGWQIIPLHWNP